VSASDVIIVTGGLGFIGKNFVQCCLERGFYVRNIDKVTYAADLTAKRAFETRDNYHFIETDIRDLDYLPECDVVVNFAAESHVDNAIVSNTQFCETNFMGTQNLLELVRAQRSAARPLFVQVSTDEVYGDIETGTHDVHAPLKPSNPYSATKAAADLLVQSWGRTYGSEWNIVRPCNCYGLHQYPEKLIPRSAWRMKRGLPALMHGSGEYVRSWLHVEDAAEAILTVIEHGERNRVYNAGSGFELRNIDVLRQLADIAGVSHDKAWTQVEDRSGQDVRYSIDDEDLRALGWCTERDFDRELRAIVRDFDFSHFA